MDLIGPLVILGRGGFLDSILTGDEVGEHRPPIRPGGRCKGLPGLKGRGIGAQEGGLDGGPRQQLAGLCVLFQHDQLGLFIVGDVQDFLLPLGHRHIIGGLGGHNVSLRGG